MQNLFVQFILQVRIKNANVLIQHSCFYYNEIQDESLLEVLRNEMLISEIQKREPLWNYKISVSERGRHTIQKL